MTLEQVFDIIYTAETIEEAKERIFAFEHEEREQGDLRIRRIVREELAQWAKKKREDFAERMTQVIEMSEDDLETLL